MQIVRVENILLLFFVQTKFRVFNLLKQRIVTAAYIFTLFDTIPLISLSKFVKDHYVEVICL